MTNIPKGCDKIILVLFRKAYVGLKSISCITFLPGLVVSPVAWQSEGPGFEYHTNFFLYYNGENLSVIILLGCKLSHVFS